MTNAEKIAALEAENRDLRARLAAVSAAGKALRAVEMEASPDVDEFFDVLAEHGFDFDAAVSKTDSVVVEIYVCGGGHGFTLVVGDMRLSGRKCCPLQYAHTQGEVSVGRAALTELAEQIDAAAAGGTT